MRRVVLRPLRDRARAVGRAIAGHDYAHDASVGWAPASKPARRTLPFIVLALAFTIGVVDAVSSLGLGHIFTASQTGNVLVLGFALAGTEGFTVAPPAVSLGSIFAGA
jgi:uncharacterized protein DUF1275